MGECVKEKEVDKTEWSIDEGGRGTRERRQGEGGRAKVQELGKRGGKRKTA